MNKVLIVAAHPDDEILGVGGTILKHVKNGDEVSVLILGDGESSRGNNKSEIKKRENDVKRRENQAKKVAKILGVKNIFLEKLPDNEFDSVSLLKITKIIENIIFQLKPNIIYTHCLYDLNIDHKLTFEAVLTACRPQPGFFVKKILVFETLSSTEWQIKDSKHAFCPTQYVDISKFINKKIEVLKIYKSELREYPHPRSLEGVRILAKFRGIEVGYKYAEAFQIIRILN